MNQSNYSKALLFIFLIVLSNFVYSQNNKEDDDGGAGFVINAFSNSLEVMMQNELNIYRGGIKLDSCSPDAFLKKLSAMQAEYMVINKENKPLRKKGKLKSTQQRSKSLGGSAAVEEMTFKIAAKKGKEVFTESTIISELLKLLKKNKEYPLILEKSEYNRIGVSARMDEKLSNVYFSIVFGSYKSLNDGADLRKALKIPFSKNAKDLKLPDNKTCINCNKFKDYPSLYNGLKIIKGEVFFYYNDSKQLRKLLKKATDGLAIDIIQKVQYSNSEAIITNYNLPCRGILLKPVYPDKIFEVGLPPKGTKKPKNPPVYVSLGKIPKKLKGEFELNLLIIQNNKVCKTLKRSYIENGMEGKINNDNFLLSSEQELTEKADFDPKGESPILFLNVPFSKNKFTFSDEDIKPLFDALNEPDFNIDGVYIYSFSSIEGDSISNSALQKKRAESIQTVINSIQKRQIPTYIKTQDSWDLFRLDVEDTKFEYLAMMKKKEAIAVINSKQMSEELEPILSKERFARIVMDISYDLSKNKIENYCIKKIQSFLKKGKKFEALEVLEFAKKKMDEGVFEKSFFNKINIPNEKENQSLLNNLWVYKTRQDGYSVTEDDLEKLELLWKLDSLNCELSYNLLNLKLKFNYLNSETERLKNLLSNINKCSAIPEEKIRDINLTFQFSMLSYLDTFENKEAEKADCISKIKEIAKTKGENSIETATMLAKLFNKNLEFEFAIGLLEPFIGNPKITEEAIFTYISSCAQIESKVNSKKFESALDVAISLNSKRFCELFGSPCLSFQLLENPTIKQKFNLQKCEPNQ